MGVTCTIFSSVRHIVSILSLDRELQLMKFERSLRITNCTVYSTFASEEMAFLPCAHEALISSLPIIDEPIAWSARGSKRLPHNVCERSYNYQSSFDRHAAQPLSASSGPRVSYKVINPGDTTPHVSFSFRARVFNLIQSIPTTPRRPRLKG